MRENKPWREVMNGTLEPGGRGGKQWVVDLECGHTSYRQAARRGSKMPTKLRCIQCPDIGQLDINELGVDGSLHRRLYDLMVSLGLTLVEIKDGDHPSRLTMVFDNDTHMTTIVIDDTEKGEPTIELTGLEKIRDAAAACLKSQDTLDDLGLVAEFQDELRRALGQKTGLAFPDYSKGENADEVK